MKDESKYGIPLRDFDHAADNNPYIIDTEISSRKKDYVKMIRKMPIGNANDANSLVKKRRSSYHKRERRKLTSEQHRIAISIDL